MAHVTGGGLAANLARVVPAELEVVLDRATWTPPPVFSLVRDVGQVAVEDLEHTLNMGVGMVAVLDPADADRALEVLQAADVRAWVLGEVRAAAAPAAGAGELAGGAVHLSGRHPGW